MIFQGDKYLDAVERLKELSKQNQILSKELTASQRELDEETTKMENQMQAIEKKSNEMKKTIAQQDIVIAYLKAENARITGDQKLYLKRTDMLRNMKLLNDALESKKISEEKHTVRMRKNSSICK